MTSCSMGSPPLSELRIPAEICDTRGRQAAGLLPPEAVASTAVATCFCPPQGCAVPVRILDRTGLAPRLGRLRHPRMGEADLTGCAAGALRPRSCRRCPCPARTGAPAEDPPSVGQKGGVERLGAAVDLDVRDVGDVLRRPPDVQLVGAAVHVP